jgi:hypothetical protein
MASFDSGNIGYKGTIIIYLVTEANTDAKWETGLCPITGKDYI